MASEDKRELWRGYSLSYWHKEAAKMAGLRKIIRLYSTSEMTIETRREDLILQTMRVLDNYQPWLTDGEAQAAIRFQRAPVRDAQLQTTGQPAEAGPSIGPEEPPIDTSTAIGAPIVNEQPAENRPSTRPEEQLVGPPVATVISTIDGQPPDVQAENNSAHSISGHRSTRWEGAPAGPAVDTTRAQSPQGPVTASNDSVGTQRKSITEPPQVSADQASAISNADQAIYQTATAKPPKHNGNFIAEQPHVGPSTSPVDVEDAPPVEAIVVVTQLPTSSSSISDDLRRAVRRYLLQVTDAKLQPMEGYHFLLPIQNTVGNKTIVDGKAFGLVFDDNNDPGIHSIQVEFVQGQSPNTHFYRCSRVGYALQYRGRGPVWKDNSCHVDCCIVAARLMSVGQVNADLSEMSRPNELKELTPFQGLFRDTLALPWEIYTRETNIRQRHEFLNKYYAQRAALGKGGSMGSMHAANDSWQICAEGFGQFEYTVYKRTTCDRCSKVSLVPTNLTKTGVLEFDAPTIEYWRNAERDNITELFNKHFGPKPFRGCTKRGCGGQTSRTRIVHGELPQRIVVPTPAMPFVKAGQPPIPKDRNIVGATSNLITVTYQTETGQETAHYRWLGGIYEYNKHFRLYWSDRDSGDGDNLLVYDGTRLNGSIIGGVPPYDPHDAVPPPWSKGCDILFYERIYLEKAQVNADAVRAKINDILSQEQLSSAKRRYSEEWEESTESNKIVEESGPPRKKSGSPKSLRSCSK